MEPLESLSKLYKFISDKKISSVRKMFHGPIAINTPLSAAVNGDEAFYHLLDNEGRWLERHLISVEALSTIKGESRIAIELSLSVKINANKTDIPVILLGDLIGKQFGQIRTYHSTWPINKSNAERPPIVWPRQEGSKPEVLETYLNALQSGDIETIISILDTHIKIQEPSGKGFSHIGIEACSKFFHDALADGGLGISHATLVQEKERICIEYICDSWGRNHFKPMAGCTVYELNSSFDKIKAIRVYDDIAIPNDPLDAIEEFSAFE